MLALIRAARSSRLVQQGKKTTMNISKIEGTCRSITKQHSSSARALLGALALTATMMIGARDAHAAGHAFIFDHFETGGWQFFVTPSATSFDGYVGVDPQARSPSNSANLGIFTTNTSAWGAVFKTFTAPSQQNFSVCSAVIYLRPELGFRGSLDMINPSNNTYIGSTPLNIAMGNDWVQEAVVNNYGPCTRSIQLRVVVSSTTGQDAFIDDAEVMWFWN